MPGRKKWFREIINGLLLAAIAVFAIYVYWVVSFSDMHLLFKLKTANVRVQAQQLVASAKLQEKAVVAAEKKTAWCDFMVEEERWISYLAAARQKGFKEQVLAYWQYCLDDIKLRSVYNRRIQKARLNAGNIRRQQEIYAKSLVRGMEKENNAFTFLFMDKGARRDVKGYLYDPDNGEVIAR